MKRTKREQNAIMTTVVLFWILTILLAYFSYTYIYPNMLEIEATKVEVKELYEQKKQKEKTGIDYKDFQDSYPSILSKEKKQDTLNASYKDSITKSIDENFFTKYFVNETEPTFSAFIEKYKSELQLLPTDTPTSIKKINFILPSYVSDLVDIDLQKSGKKEKDIHFLTDFRFVNYIETLMDEFNLNYKNSIGITDVTLVEGYAVNDSGTTLDKNIYYIPVELDLIWDKRYVLLFLYYLEHVGTITVDDTTKEVTILNTAMLTEDSTKQDTQSDETTVNIETDWLSSWDVESTSTDTQQNPNIQLQEEKEKNIIYKSALFKRLEYIKVNDYQEKNEWQKHNVFNNQLIDIESITFPDYIDSNPSFWSLLSSEENDLISNISQQLKDEFRLKLKLRFYIKGLPKYKIEELIQGTVDLYTKLQKEVTDSMSNKELDRVDMEKVRNINETLKAVSDQINTIKVIKKWQQLTLTEKYNKSYEVKRLLLELEEDITHIIQ